MKKKVSLLLGTASAVMLGLSMTCGIAAAQDCGPAVNAAKAEWHSLSSGNRRIAPSMLIRTSDGRQMSGSSLNYAGVLLDRAAFACIDPEPAKAMALLSEAEAIMHPPVR